MESAQAGSSTAGAARAVTLSLGGPEGDSKTFVVRIGEVLRIGRGPANDFVVSLDGVSTLHAEFFLRDEGGGDGPCLFIRDTSKNGTGFQTSSRWQPMPRGGLQRLESGSELLLPFKGRPSDAVDLAHTLTVQITAPAAKSAENEGPEEDQLIGAAIKAKAPRRRTREEKEKKKKLMKKVKKAQRAAKKEKREQEKRTRKESEKEVNAPILKAKAADEPVTLKARRKRRREAEDGPEVAAVLRPRRTRTELKPAVRAKSELDADPAPAPADEVRRPGRDERTRRRVAAEEDEEPRRLRRRSEDAPEVERSRRRSVDEDPPTRERRRGGEDEFGRRLRPASDDGESPRDPRVRGGRRRTGDEEEDGAPQKRRHGDDDRHRRRSDEDDHNSRHDGRDDYNGRHSRRFDEDRDPRRRHRDSSYGRRERSPRSR